MSYPNPVQWVVLWCAVAAIAWVLLIQYANYRRYYEYREVAVILAAAAVLFWQASRWWKK